MKEECCSSFFFDCSVECQHCNLQCGAMIGHLSLQTWKQCDWLRKYPSISVLCPGLSLCLSSSLNTVLGVCMLQKPLQYSAMVPWSLELFVQDQAKHKIYSAVENIISTFQLLLGPKKERALIWVFPGVFTDSQTTFPIHYDPHRHVTWRSC